MKGLDYRVIQFDEAVRADIEEKKAQLDKSSHKSKILAERTRDVITKEALNHSYWIENRNKERRRTGRTDNPEQDMAESRGGLEKAWALTKNIDFDNLSIPDLQALNMHIYPHEGGRLRQGRVHVSGSSVSRPNPLSVQNKLDRFIGNYGSLSSTVDRALLASMRLLYIHPFSDGNGRLTRLVANGILDQKGFPGIVIPEGERTLYFNLLETAMSRYVDRGGCLDDTISKLSTDEETFYTYLASKINQGLNESIDNILAKRLTTVTPYFKNGKNYVGLYKTVVNNLRALSSKRHLDLRIKHQKSSPEISILGPISIEECSAVLDSMQLVDHYSLDQEE